MPERGLRVAITGNYPGNVNYRSFAEPLRALAAIIQLYPAAAGLNPEESDVGDAELGRELLPRDVGAREARRGKGRVERRVDAGRACLVREEQDRRAARKEVADAAGERLDKLLEPHGL